MSRSESGDRALEFTVSTIWRDERVTCPHTDILQSWRGGALDPAAAEFVEFHVRESQCPYCNAALADIEAAEREVEEAGTAGLEDRLMRSTVSELRRRGGRA